MGRIQSDIGLVSGIPITETVDKLMKIASRPRDLLISRVNSLREQQVAVNGLTAMTIAIQLAARNIGKAAVFEEQNVTSSRPELLTATKSGDPAPGNYRFTPIRQSQTHQLLSGGIAAADQPLGAGNLSLRFGGFVDTAAALSTLNGGAGVQRGKIRITDRSGASEIIDVSTAQSIDDVLQAINSAETIQVSAAVQGDAIQLTDLTGLSASNLRVQNVGTGTTATDLGLAGIDVATSTAAGQDIVSLYGAVSLDLLNDGNGVQTRDGVADLEINFRDGSSALQIDFGDIAAQGGDLQAILDQLNAADPARLEARISADGDRLELIDLTAGGGQFTVASINGGQTAEDLGLVDAAAGGTITGRRLLGGLKSTLLSSLNGGRGFESLGSIQITDRAGGTATIDLSTVETLDDIVATINAANVGVTAAINSARNGLQLTDSTGGAGNLVVTNADSTNTATQLGLEFDDDANAVNSGTLHRQVISRQTRLDSMNQGQGVATGSFTITDAAGKAGAVNLAVLEPKTVGDVIDAINGLGLALEATINEAGDGIALVDTSGGTGGFKVEDSGSGTSALDLGIAGQSQLSDLQGVQRHVLQGSSTFSVEIGADDTLEDLVKKINEADRGVSAAIFNDGSGIAPYRLAITSQIAGKAGELLLDSSGSGLKFSEISAAQDALLLVGANGSAGGILTSSSSGTFDGVVEGLSLTVNGTSTDSVQVSVAASDKSLMTNVKLFVDKYNELVKKLAEYTKFDATTNTTGILFGTTEALRVQNALGQLASGTFFGAGKIRSLEEVGIGLRDDGQLELDETKLKAIYSSRPDDLKEFFTTEQFGVSARFDDVIDRLSGEGNSLLVSRNQALQDKIDMQGARIDSMTARLDREREAMLNRFYQLESSIARMQNGLAAISNIQQIPPLGSS